MPSRRKKPRKTRSRNTPLRIWVLLVTMVVAAVAGVTTVKWLKTTPGKVFLIDRGLVGYYPDLQEILDPELRRVMERFGVAEGMSERIETVTVGNRRFGARVWEAQCEPPCNILLLNLALTKTVRRTGAIIRRSEETDGGAQVAIEIGSHEYPTHTIHIQRIDRPIELTPTPKEPRLALVIDDFGYSRSGVVKSFLEMDLPLTIAVIPDLRFSKWALSRAVDRGKQTILHLPMEAEEQEADVHMVSTVMDDMEIERMVRGYLDDSPNIVGVNNHMGSKATQDPRVMETVLGVIDERGLFFLDSLTSNKSIAYNKARTLGVPTARNDLFLDGGTEDPVVVEDRIYQLVNLAKRRGLAIGIGHPKPWTLEAFERSEEFIRNAGVELVFLSQVVE